MPNYTFELRDGSDPIGDELGVILTDRLDAYDYARGVVRELMCGREAQTRTWRLDVYENSAERVFEIPFASLDRTLDDLLPELRMIVEGLCECDRTVRRGEAEGAAGIARSPRSFGGQALPHHQFRQADDKRRLVRRFARPP